MNRIIQDCAIQVMEELMAHPICHDFLEPFVPGQDDENYFDVITNPQDLGTIKNRLINGEYKTISQWANDINLVWSNAIKFYNKNTYLYAFAVEGKNIFTKLRRKVDVLIMSSWCTEVYRLRCRVFNLMCQPPAKVKQYASSLGAAHTMKQPMPAPTEREIQNFVAASEMIRSEEDMNEMIRIIDEMQLELDNGSTDIRIDVAKLNLPTIYALREYMRTALEKAGLKYPE